MTLVGSLLDVSVETVVEGVGDSLFVGSSEVFFVESVGVGVTMVVVDLGGGSAPGSLFEHPVAVIAVAKANAMIEILRVVSGIGTPSFSCYSVNYMEVLRISGGIVPSR